VPHQQVINSAYHLRPAFSWTVRQPCSYLTPATRRTGRATDRRSDKMRDEMDSRIWAEHGHAFSEDLATFFANIGAGFRRLNEIRFDAPWKRHARGPGHA
jgi:hypothetical protein